MCLYFLELSQYNRLSLLHTNNWYGYCAPTLGVTLGGRIWGVVNRTTYGPTAVCNHRCPFRIGTPSCAVNVLPHLQPKFPGETQLQNGHELAKKRNRPLHFTGKLGCVCVVLLIVLHRMQ